MKQHPKGCPILAIIQQINLHRPLFTNGLAYFHNRLSVSFWALKNPAVLSNHLIFRIPEHLQEPFARKHNRVATDGRVSDCEAVGQFVELLACTKRVATIERVFYIEIQLRFHPLPSSSSSSSSTATTTANSSILLGWSNPMWHSQPRLLSTKQKNTRPNRTQKRNT